MVSESWTCGISGKRSAVAHHLEQVAVGIEKVDAIVIAPIDSRGTLDPSRCQALARAGKIVRLDLERVMTAAERVRDDRLARSLVERRPRNLEKREVLAAAIEQHLIAETVNYSKAEDVCIEALREPKVRHFDTEMIQPLEFHGGHR